MPAASPLEPTWVRRRLRVPREPGAVLAIPPVCEMPAAIESNLALIADWNVDCLGEPLSELRQLARHEALAAARLYTDWLDQTITVNSPKPSSPASPRLNCDLPASDQQVSSLIVGGHQPELFHCGVWAKNFVLDRLANQTGGIGLNLIVDSDTLSSTRIAVPVGSKERPLLEQIPFDADADFDDRDRPLEEIGVRDESLFRSCAERVSDALTCWPIDPLITSIWPSAISMLSQDSSRLPDVLTAARRHAEQIGGVQNLELPLSRLCQTEAFAWFVCHMLSDVRRLHATYNAVVEEYRHINHVQSTSHPVPNLAVGLNGTASNSDGWYEAPFWIWRVGDRVRGRLFVKQTTTELLLSDGHEVLGSLELSANIEPANSVSQLRELMKDGIKIRTRALTTTMFARVFLGDAFLHGMGGAKYDEMTDRLIARLFGIAPPAYLTMTATMHLPLPSWNTTSHQLSQLRHRLKDFDRNADRHATPADWPATNSTEAASLLSEKQQLVAKQIEQDALSNTDRNRHAKAENFQRCRRLRQINQRLAQLGVAVRERIQTDLTITQAQLTANEILRSREFSFCLFPADEITQTLRAAQ